ncbi:unnamed protein product [Urochloa humidicola]
MGDWYCPVPSCGHMNFARRIKCGMCEAPCPASGGCVSGERLSGDCGTGDNGSGAGGGVKRDGGDYISGPWEELAPMNVKSTGIEQRPGSTFVMQGETGAQSNPMAGESGIGEASIPNDLHESNLLEWVEALESSNDPHDLPPFDIVLFPGMNFIDVFLQLQLGELSGFS